jgi:cell division protein FtsL
MMRTLNFALVIIAGIVCVATYRVAEDARVARAQLAKAERDITREHQALSVLGAEWAQLTRPQRIHALAERHLQLHDMPAIELASFSMLPRRGEAPLTDAPLRDASIVVPMTEAAPEAAPEPQTVAQPVVAPPLADPLAGEGVRRISYRSGA